MTKHVMLFEDFARTHSTPIDEKLIIEQLSKELDFLVEGSGAALAMLTIGSAIVAVKARRRYKFKKRAIEKELLDMEDGPKKEALKKSLMKLSKEEVSVEAARQGERIRNEKKAKEAISKLTSEETAEYRRTIKELEDKLEAEKAKLAAIE